MYMTKIIRFTNVVLILRHIIYLAIHTWSEATCNSYVGRNVVSLLLTKIGIRQTI